MLDEAGLDFYEQYPIGNHVVDAFVPLGGIVLEADGEHWHKSLAKEDSRDRYLLRNPIVRSVVHLTEEQLRPWILRERPSSSRYRPSPIEETAATP